MSLLVRIACHGAVALWIGLYLAWRALAPPLPVELPPLRVEPAPIAAAPAVEEMQPLPLESGDLARGDLGRSFRDRRPVAAKITERLGITVLLNTLALVVMVLTAVPLGALAAWRPGSALDRAAGVGTYLLYSLPVFWAALLLQILLAVKLDWLPLAGLGSDGMDQAGALAMLSFDTATRYLLVDDVGAWKAAQLEPLEQALGELERMGGTAMVPQVERSAAHSTSRLEASLRTLRLESASRPIRTARSKPSSTRSTSRSFSTRSIPTSGYASR